MFKFLEKKRKRSSLPKPPGADLASPDESGSSSSSSSDDEDELPPEPDASSSTDEDGSDDGDADEENGEEGGVRVPGSLFAALEDPVVSFGDVGLAPDDSDGPDSDASIDSDEEEGGGGGAGLVDAGVKECVMCPGKKLKSSHAVTEHLSSKVRPSPPLAAPHRSVLRRRGMNRLTRGGSRGSRRTSTHRLRKTDRCRLTRGTLSPSSTRRGPPWPNLS